MQIGIRLAITGDWMASITNIRKSLDVFEELFGESSEQCEQLQDLLQVMLSVSYLHIASLSFTCHRSRPLWREISRHLMQQFPQERSTNDKIRA